MTQKKNQKIIKISLDLFDIISFFVFALGILLFIRFFIVNPFSVVGSSMEPNYSNKDFILVDKVNAHFEKYARGDVIIFIPPNQDRPFIKRIIGLSGETIKLKDGNVEICHQEGCKKLEEKYLPKETKTLGNCDINEFKVKSGYFVLGDNRGGSTDSRCCFNSLGCIEGESFEVPKKNIVGKTFLRIFPNFGFIN